MSAEQTDVLVRMTTSVVGVGRTGARLTVSSERAAELVAMGVAVFEDPELAEAWRTSSAHVDPDVAAAAQQAKLEALEAEFDEQQQQARAAREQEAGDDGKARPRVRESRPRGVSGARDGSSGTSGAADNPGSAEPGEGNIAG
jgi:hypothetical protein